jgi:hypothetical protein
VQQLLLLALGKLMIWHDDCLHPQMGEVLSRKSVRPIISDIWRKKLGRAATPPSPGIIAEHPLIATRALIDAMDARTTHMMAMLSPHLLEVNCPDWGFLPPADVLSIDLAIVTDPDTDGWDIRFVEVQAFTSIAASAVVLSAAHRLIHPQLAGQLPHGTSAKGWPASLRAAIAPRGGILLENAPRSQGTFFDLEASSLLWGLPIIEPRALHKNANKLSAVHDNKSIPVPHIVNRMILHEAPAPHDVKALLSFADVSWHSHPAWYYRVEKGTLTELPLASKERCVLARHWRELGLAPEHLVLKGLHGYGGKSVFINVDERQLDDLSSPDDWLVQPRFTVRPLFLASDGAPLHVEVRCIFSLRHKEPWLMGRLARVSRGSKASRQSLKGSAGEGFSLLYDPPV